MVEQQTSQESHQEPTNRNNLFLLQTITIRVCRIIVKKHRMHESRMVINNDYCC